MRYNMWVPSHIFFMRKGLIFILLGVSVVLSVTFAAYLVLSKFEPEAEIRRMLVVMSEVETLRQKTAFSWTRGGEERVNTTIYASGQVNMEEIADVEHVTRFRVVRLTKGKNYSDVSGEVRRIGGVTYLTYKPPGPDVPAIEFGENETWVSFEPGEFPAWGSVLPGIDVPLFPHARARQAWTSEGIIRLREMLRVADIFHVRHDDLTEIIGGVNTRIIDARVDGPAARAFLRDVIRAKEQREPTDSERLQVEAQAVALEKLTFRLWIGIPDHRLYRLQAAGAIPEGEESVLVPADILLEFSDFNADFDAIIPPSGQTTTFERLLGTTFGMFEESADMTGSSRFERQEFVRNEPGILPAITVQKSLDPDNDGLDNTLELFYGTDPNHADTDGDGVSDGDEVFSGKNPRGEGSLFGFGF